MRLDLAMKRLPEVTKGAMRSLKAQKNYESNVKGKKNYVNDDEKLKKMMSIINDND